MSHPSAFWVAALAAVLLLLPAPGAADLVRFSPAGALHPTAPQLSSPRPAGAQHSEEGAWDEAIARFERRIEAQVAADDAGGISAAVTRGSEVVWGRGFGWSDRDRRIPAGVGSIYRVGSISKTVTAVVMMQAVERGYIELDQQLGAVFPAVDGFYGTDNVPHPSFREFASHTAGLVREPAWDSAASGPIERWQERIVTSISHSGFQSPPGTEYSYSNIGYGVLGLAVARAVGRSFMELVEEDVFGPLGMTSSTFIVGPSLAPRLAVGYQNREGAPPDPEVPAREHRGRGYKVPNGGVYSTVTDLARFMGALQGRARPSVLSEASLAEMTRVQTPESRDSGYGLGLMVRTGEDGSRFLGHSGSVAGYNAFMLFEPESGLGVVLLRNYDRSETSLGEAGQQLLVDLLEAIE